MPVPFFLTFYCSSPLRWQQGFMLILLVIPAPVRIPHSLSERPHCLNTRAVCCSPSHVIPWPLYSQDLLLALCIGGPSPRLLGTCCLRSELAWEFEAQHPPPPFPPPALATSLWLSVHVCGGALLSGDGTGWDVAPPPESRAGAGWRCLRGDLCWDAPLPAFPLSLPWVPASPVSWDTHVLNHLHTGPHLCICSLSSVPRNHGKWYSHSLS